MAQVTLSVVTQGQNYIAQIGSMCSLMIAVAFTIKQSFDFDKMAYEFSSQKGRTTKRYEDLFDNIEFLDWLMNKNLIQYKKMRSIGTSNNNDVLKSMAS